MKVKEENMVTLKIKCQGNNHEIADRILVYQ